MLIDESELLLLDEPVANLDRESADQVYDLFCEPAKQGTTIFLTSSEKIYLQ